MPDFVGFRIWYADGSVKSNLDGAWQALPSQEVQYVTFYSRDTYQIWIDTEWVTENYVAQFYSQDYYWLDAGGWPGAGSAEQVPADLEQGMLKTGSTMFEETGVAFWDLAAQAQMVRVAP